MRRSMSPLHSSLPVALSIVVALILLTSTRASFFSWGATTTAAPVIETGSILRTSQTHFEHAVLVSNHSVSVLDLASGVDALMPVITVLASFVTTPLQKDTRNLRNAASLALEPSARTPVDLEALVRDERALAGYVGHRPVEASAYWSLLFLDFFEHILDGVLARGERTLDASGPEGEKTANRAIRDAAVDAYDRTYAKHHNAVLRAIARKVLNFLPSREKFYTAFGKNGRDRKRWSRDLRGELKSFLGALRPCLARLKDHFAEHVPDL